MDLDVHGSYHMSARTDMNTCGQLIVALLVFLSKVTVTTV
jgi:hypothetical protein